MTNNMLEPPFSQEAEQNVLSAILIDFTLMKTIKAIISAEDFFMVRHEMIFRAMERLDAKGEPVDLVTLAAELPADKLEGVGGRTYLVKLMNVAGTSIYGEVYARLVKRTSVRRKLIAAARAIEAFAYDESLNIEEVESQSLNEVSTALERTRSQGAWFSDVASTIYDQVERAVRDKVLNAIPTGFYDLDKMHGGGLDAGLTVLAGRTGMGKSSMMDSILYNQIIMMAEGKIDPFTIFYATTERTKEEVVRRVTSIASEIADVKLRTGNLTGDEAAKFTKQIGIISEARVYIDDTPAVTPAQLESTANWLVRQHGCKLVLHDGAYRSTTGVPRLDNGDNVHAKYSRIYFDLKNASTRLNVPILTTHQLNREADKRNDHRPRLSDLTGSGTIEQECNNVWFIYRDAVYNEASDTPNQADIIVAKQRNGPTGVVPIYYEATYTKFMNASINRVDLSDLE